MTKASLATQRQLLKALSTGEFHSGQKLAEALGISRTAVANHVKQLQQLGLDVYKVKGKGYKSAQPLSLLDAAKINRFRQDGCPDVLVQSITNSTNSQLMQRVTDRIVTDPGYVLVAEAQTEGRGRRGRSWYSPFAASLYFSMYWRLEQGFQAAMGLSLVVAIALVRLLAKQYNVEAKIKWPNDVYINGRKLAGILVELAGQAHASCEAIIGIGLNIRLPEIALSNIDQHYTDLVTEADTLIDRNELVAKLQNQLIDMFNEFSRTGFASFVDEFNCYDFFRGKSVKLSGSAGVSGICCGVDNQGALIVRTPSGLQTFFAGELSLRAGD